MKSFRSGGITRRTACGRITKRSACQRVSPSERAAASCDGCTDSMPAAVDLGDVRRVDRARARRSPRTSSRSAPPRELRAPARRSRASRSRGSSARRGRSRRRRSPARAAGRRPAPAGSGSPRSGARRSRMNTSAMQKIFTLSRNARAISGSEPRNSPQLKNVCRDLGPAGRVASPPTPTTTKKTIVLSERDRHAPAAVAGAPARRGASSCGLLLQDRRAGRLR